MQENQRGWIGLAMESASIAGNLSSFMNAFPSQTGEPLFETMAVAIELADTIVRNSLRLYLWLPLPKANPTVVTHAPAA